MSKKRQSIWKEHPELEDRLKYYIAEEGILDAEHLADLMSDEAKDFGIKGGISVHSIHGKKAHLARTDKAVKARIREQEKKELIEERHAIKEAILKGRWLAVLGIDPNVDFSQYIPEDTGASNPFYIRAKDEKAPNLMTINAPLVGSLVEENPDKDVFRNSLKYAEHSNLDAVLITGDLIYMLTQKWGTKKPRKVNVVGIEPDPKIIEQTYPKAVLKEKGIEERLRDKDVVFTTVKARLDLAIQELAQAFRHQNGSPIFSGPVYVILGEMEDEISTHYATEMVRVLVRQEKDRAQRAIDFLKHEKRYEEDKRRLAKLQDEISDWYMYKHVLALMSNHDESQVKELSEQMVGYIVKQINEAVPNCVVAGRSDAFLNAGDRKIFVTRGKATTAYRGTSAGIIREKTYTHIKNNPGLSIPDAILVGGFNPYWTGLYASHRIPELAGTLDDRHMTHIIQLPTALNAETYRETLRNFPKVQGKIEKVAEVSDFQSGATILRWFKEGSILVPETLSSDLLRNEEIFSSTDKLKEVITGNDRRSRMIYSNKQGCEHAGARFITQYPSPNDPDGRLVKSHFQVCFEAFINSDAPIHMFQSDGDTLHWANYAVHKEGYPDNRLTLPEYLDKLIELMSNKNINAAKREKMIATLSFEYAISEGVLQPDGQLAFYQHLLRPVKDFIFNVIEKARESGLKTVGPRLAEVTQGQGNHNERSFRRGDVNISEAEFVRRGILEELLDGASPQDHSRIKEAVVAAVFSDVGEARGMFGIPCDQDREYTEDEIVSLDKSEGYFYALYMMHKQGTSKTKDNMAPMLKAFRNRLTEHQYEANRFSINLGGDDHTGGWALTRTALHVKSGCQMGGNSFGRKSSFPEQNIFSAVWGVPAGGPAWGPMRVIVFDQHFARHYANKPFKLPVDELFINPA
ncbi:MAG: hypothetical protein R3251_02615 [Candidatus Spechtbacterales bacterium]|nr:hypothetical protein [Candidatus Spechtbacterales bacterium]